MKSAIVSGTNGFVGSAVVRELLSKGIAVCALVHRADISSELDGARVVVCDREHYSDLPALIGDFRPEVFITSRGRVRPGRCGATKKSS